MTNPPATARPARPLVPAQTRFQHFPDEPNHDQAWNAYVILRNTHDAAASFLDIFERVRATRQARGAPTDEEQDLLRAMLSFTSSGLDSLVKQLIRDALPSVIAAQQGAQENFRSFVEKRISRQQGADGKFLALVLTHPDPRSVLFAEIVRELTSSSLQSAEELLKAASYFDIPSAAVCGNVAALKQVFHARNQIAHEMDVDFTQQNRSRRPRSRASMIASANTLFEVGRNFLQQVDTRLGTTV